MGSAWKPVKELRKTADLLLPGCYSEEYVKRHRLLDKSSSHTSRPGLWTKYWVPEPIFVSLDDFGQPLYRSGEVGTRPQAKKENGWEQQRTDLWPTERTKTFETARGRFTSADSGEWGGILCTPTGCLSGNFVEVVEHAGTVYAMDSLVHWGSRHFRLIAFSDSLEPVELYPSHPTVDGQHQEAFSFQALFLGNDSLYVLASGAVKEKAPPKAEAWVSRSRLFQLRDGKIQASTTFDLSFSAVCNMIVHDHTLILGMDKVVAIVDLDTRGVETYTPISIEAERDLLTVRTQFQ